MSYWIKMNLQLERFSKLSRLLNTTAYLLKLYRRFKKGGDKEDRCISARDIEEAEMFWINDAQKSLHKRVINNELKRLCPQLRYDGIIVVAGRAERQMQMTWNKQAFILLPRNHRLSTLIAEKVHQETGHLVVSDTVAAVRSKFWIMDIQRLEKSICHKCVICTHISKIIWTNHGKVAN